MSAKVQALLFPFSVFLGTAVPSVRCVPKNRLPGQKLELLSTQPSLQDRGGLCGTYPHPQLFIRKRWSYITKMAQDPMH